MPRQHNNSRELPQHHPLHQRFFGSRSHALLPIRRELIGTSISDQRRGGAAGEDAAPEGPPPTTSYTQTAADGSGSSSSKPKQANGEAPPPAISDTTMSSSTVSAALDSQLFLQQCLPWSFMSAMTLPPQSSMLYTTPAATMTSPAVDSSGIASARNMYSGSGSCSSRGGGAYGGTGNENNNQRNNGELLLSPPSFAGANSSSSASTILTTPSVMHHHPQDHLSLSDSAAAAAAAAMASAMAMAPMVPMITMAPMTSMVPMTPMAPMDVATLASPITTATLPAPISIPRLTSLEQTIMAPAIPTSMVPEQPTPSPVHQQQHSELKRSAISISNSKWNAAMINNNGSSSATVGSNGNEATTHARPLIKLAYLNVDQFYALQQLMREHGEDWALLGHVMGIRPADLSKNWEGYSVDTRVTRQWTREEMELLAICRQMGICCRTSAKIIGTKLPLQCRRKTLKPPLDAESRNARSLSLRRAASPNAGSDSEDGDDIGPNEANNWDTGHGPIDESAATTEAPPTRDSSLITNIVEQQVQASGGAVDWALVSQQSGFTIQQCLEQSLYDENKRPWKYTTTAAFDWELAQSMYQFVVQFYPQPTPINFTAVSNFLWISIVDCLHIFDILRGRINWSPNTVETVRTLWAQGWTSELIARQLSPTLSAAAFERQWVRIGRTNSLNHDVNPLIPRSIDDDSVAAIRDIVTDHTARPDCQVGAMLSAAHHALPALDRSTVDQCVLALLSVHPLYDARRTRRAKQPSAQPSASIGDTAAGIFPHEQQQQQQPEVDRRKHEQEDFATRSTPLNNTSHRMLARSNSSSTSNVGHCKRNSGRWTHEETMYLCQYVRMSRAVAIDWASFAESLGTKSAYQCKNKYRSLKRHGTLK